MLDASELSIEEVCTFEERIPEIGTRMKYRLQQALILKSSFPPSLSGCKKR